MASSKKQVDPKSLPPKGRADFDKLKQYYKNFYKNVDVGSCNTTITSWTKYRDKILNLDDPLTLEDFAGKYENGEKVSEYLVNYLAQDAAFVKSTQAESGGFTIFRGKDVAKGDYYKVSRKYTGDSEDTYFCENNMDKAEPYFKVCILSLLRLIVTAFDNKKAALNPSDVNGFFRMKLIICLTQKKPL